MAVTVTNDGINTVNVTNDAKSGEPTWEEYEDTWQEAEGTWERPNTPMVNQPSLNVVTVINDAQS